MPRRRTTTSRRPRASGDIIRMAAATGRPHPRLGRGDGLHRLLCCLMVIFIPAGAGAEEAFQKPQPGRVWQFPADHGSHPEYKTEWWYWVGHLKSSGRRDLRLPAHLLPGGLAPTGPPGPFGLAPEHRLFRPSGRLRSGPGPLSLPGKGGPGRPGAFRRGRPATSGSGSTTGRRSRWGRPCTSRPGTRAWGWT